MLAASRHFVPRAGINSLTARKFNPSLSATRSLVTLSQPKLRGYSPVNHLPPLPPPEWEADGSPRRYPLNMCLNEHGYTWEHWHIRDVGCFHTMYLAELAVDTTPHCAWLCSVPIWVGAPVLLGFLVLGIVTCKNACNLGLKPKRFTIDWIMAMKERERAENSNPVTRFLDRRVNERGHHVYMGDFLPYHYYFPWMHNSFDHEFREERGMVDLREGGKWSYHVAEE